MTNKQIKSSSDNALIGPEYDALLKDLKGRIRRAQVKAGLAVNAELVQLYWEMGKAILIQEKEQGWGAKVVDRLAKDLKAAFPDMKGFSARNLRYMKAFAESYPDEQFLQQVAAKIPWFHNCVLLDRIKEAAQRKWYLEAELETLDKCNRQV